MQLLLDTHPFIWFINGDNQLPEKIKSLIADVENECFLSVASIWEIAIKTSLGKLELQSGFDRITDFLFDNDIEILPIKFVHLQTLLKLEYYHRDPFDRIIISQGIAENFTVLSKDEIFDKYPIKLIWK
jgi:PIN domain nuclease of toxin-antitoxin system